MSVHQLHGCFDRLGSRHFRVFLQKEGGHSVAQTLDDAGDDKQQCPQRGVQNPQEVLGKTGAKPVKLAEQVGKQRFLAAALLQKESGIAQLHHAAEDEGHQSQQPRHGYQGHKNPPQYRRQIPKVVRVDVIVDAAAASGNHPTKDCRNQRHAYGNSPISNEVFPGGLSNLTCIHNHFPFLLSASVFYCFPFQKERYCFSASSAMAFWVR